MENPEYSLGNRNLMLHKTLLNFVVNYYKVCKSVGKTRYMHTTALKYAGIMPNKRELRQVGQYTSCCKFPV